MDNEGATPPTGHRRSNIRTPRTRVLRSPSRPREARRRSPSAISRYHLRQKSTRSRSRTCEHDIRIRSHHSKPRASRRHSRSRESMRRYDRSREPSRRIDRNWEFLHNGSVSPRRQQRSPKAEDAPRQLTHDDNSGNDADAGFATVEESTDGKRNVYKAWSDNDLTAQAALFFVAGFETVSTAMTFLMYELAVNPKVQERLAQEIKDREKANGGIFDYNSIQTMTYLDMVVSEVLRLWPSAIASERLCVKKYNLGKPNEKASADYIVNVNDSINIPIFSIHRDPRYFPNPLKFDPERFSDENEHRIHPFTYMPFGLGPRNCIGSRFALCEVKVMIYQLLQHMKLEPSKRTPIPLQLSTGTFNLRIRGGHWLQLRSRN